MHMVKIGAASRVFSENEVCLPTGDRRTGALWLLPEQRHAYLCMRAHESIFFFLSTQIITRCILYLFKKSR